MSVSNGEQRRRRASEYGAAEFITKPVYFTFLKAQLRRLPLAPAGEAYSDKPENAFAAE